MLQERKELKAMWVLQVHKVSLVILEDKVLVGHKVQQDQEAQQELKEP